VQEWRAVWRVRIRRAKPGAWPKTEVYEKVSFTPAQPRELLEEARRDSEVLAVPYTQPRELVDSLPER
jgi:hypothetical protein